MKIEIINTTMAEDDNLESRDFSTRDSEKAVKLVKSMKALLTQHLLQKLLKDMGEADLVETRWSSPDNGNQLSISHVFHITENNDSKFPVIKQKIDELIENFPYYLYMCEGIELSKPIEPLILNKKKVENLDTEIKEFVRDFISTQLAIKGSIICSGFFIDENIQYDRLKITAKESNDTEFDPNHIYTVSGEVIDFNYEFQCFTLLEAVDSDEITEEQRAKIKFYFSADEFKNANQEAYFHRYCYEPRPVITFKYHILSKGKFVCFDLMDDSQVGFGDHSIR